MPLTWVPDALRTPSLLGWSGEGVGVLRHKTARGLGVLVPPEIIG